MTTVIHLGDCIEVMRKLPEASMHAVVTDPPYGLEFLEKSWDSFGDAKFTKPGIGPREIAWPSFGGDPLQGANPTCALCGGRARGGKKCACPVPDWRVKGAPITAEHGKTSRAFQLWTTDWARECFRVLRPGGFILAFGGRRMVHRLGVGIEDAGFEIRDMLGWLYGSGMAHSRSARDAGKEWEGWETNLKGAMEPIILGRKPFQGSLTDNIRRWQTGALNIDACRIGEYVNSTEPGTNRYNARNLQFGYRPGAYKADTPSPRAKRGRWPNGVILDGSPPVLRGLPQKTQDFFYQAKPARGERWTWCHTCSVGIPSDDPAHREHTTERHPTVKPVELMRYLVTLVCPPGGEVLDPFAGSGTTLVAAQSLGVNSTGIENNPIYVKLAQARLAAHKVDIGASRG